MSSEDTVFSYTSAELIDLVNKALIAALPGIQESFDLEHVGKQISDDILASKKPAEKSFDSMKVKELKQWAADNDIQIPKNIKSRPDIVAFIKKKNKKNTQPRKLELIWDPKKYYTDKDRSYVYTEEGVVIAKIKDGKLVSLKKDRDEKILQKLNLKYDILSSGDVSKKIKSIRAERNKSVEILPPPSPPPSPLLPPRRPPLAIIEDISDTPPQSPRNESLEDLYQTSSETEDVGGEGVTSENKDEDIDIINRMEKKFDDLFEKDVAITKDEYTQFMTALIIKETPKNIPQLAKESNLSADKTAKILASLVELDKRFPQVAQEVKQKKLSSSSSNTGKDQPVKRKFKK